MTIKPTISKQINDDCDYNGDDYDEKGERIKNENDSSGINNVNNNRNNKKLRAAMAIA